MAGKPGMHKNRRELKSNPRPIVTSAGPVKALVPDALQPGMVRVRWEGKNGRVVDVPAADLSDILKQYSGVRVIAGQNAGSYGQIQTILERYDADQIREALDRLEEAVPDWASADFMASKIVDQGGIGLLESMFPDGGRGLSFETGTDEELTAE